MNSDFCVAVHALVFLNHKACLLSSEELAVNICTNPARVRKVMARLKKANLIETREGSVGGGYRFTLDPSGVTLAQVAQALELHFVDPAWRSGDSHLDCLVSSGMAGIMDDIFGQLNSICMEYLEELSIEDLNRKIFKDQTETTISASETG